MGERPTQGAAEGGGGGPGLVGDDREGVRRIPWYVRVGRWADRRLGGDPLATEAHTNAALIHAERRIRQIDPRRADELAEVIAILVRGPR